MLWLSKYLVLHCINYVAVTMTVIKPELPPEDCPETTREQRVPRNDSANRGTCYRRDCYVDASYCIYVSIKSCIGNHDTMPVLHQKRRFRSAFTQQLRRKVTFKLQKSHAKISQRIYIWAVCIIYHIERG